MKTSVLEQKKNKTNHRDMHEANEGPKGRVRGESWAALGPTRSATDGSDVPIEK